MACLASQRRITKCEAALGLAILAVATAGVVVAFQLLHLDTGLSRARAIGNEERGRSRTLHYDGVSRSEQTSAADNSSSVGRIGAERGDEVGATASAARIPNLVGLRSGALLTPPSSAPASSRRRPEPESMWRHRGQCSDETLTGPDSARERYLARFVRVQPSGGIRYSTVGIIYAATAVPQPIRERALFWIDNFRGPAEEYLHLSSPLPTVYLHETPQALRAHACVNDAAIAYYDGAIHVAPTEDGSWRELWRTLAHEYIHHLLQTHDIQRPIWFQEGAAMAFAREISRSWRFSMRPVELEQMNDGFPRSASAQFAQAFYGQAYVMLTFLDDLCRTGRQDCQSAPELVQVLREGTATPEKLFEWALRRWAGDIPGSRLSLLEDYVAADFKLSLGLTAAARAHRTPTGTPSPFR